MLGEERRVSVVTSALSSGLAGTWRSFYSCMQYIKGKGFTLQNYNSQHAPLHLSSLSWHRTFPCMSIRRINQGFVNCIIRNKSSHGLCIAYHSYYFTQRGVLFQHLPVGRPLYGRDHGWDPTHQQLLVLSGWRGKLFHLSITVDLVIHVKLLWALTGWGCFPLCALLHSLNKSSITLTEKLLLDLVVK